MIKITILLFILLLNSGCGGSKELTAEEIQATISAGIEHTQLANATSTYTSVPTSTPTERQHRHQQIHLLLLILPQ